MAACCAPKHVLRVAEIAIIPLSAAHMGDIARSYRPFQAGDEFILTNGISRIAATLTVEDLVSLVRSDWQRLRLKSSRPDGNTTGFTDFEPATAGKWVEILKGIAPSSDRLTVLLHPETPNQIPFLRAIEAGVRIHGATIVGPKRR
jgi:ABC-type uncharacterized transport system substrate-binding protein